MKNHKTLRKKNTKPIKRKTTCKKMQKQTDAIHLATQRHKTHCKKKAPGKKNSCQKTTQNPLKKHHVANKYSTAEKKSLAKKKQAPKNTLEKQKLQKKKKNLKKSLEKP